MNIQDWTRRIKSAKFHVENAKTDFQKQTAAFDLRALNAEFVKAWNDWQDARKAELEQIIEAQKAKIEAENAKTNQINAALQLLEDELTQAKIFTIINPAKTK